MLPDELLTSRQAAERLGVEISTISRMVSDGRLTVAFQAPGPTGVKFFRPEDIDAAIGSVIPRPKRTDAA